MTTRIAEYYRFRNLRVPWNDRYLYAEEAPKEHIDDEGVIYYLEENYLDTEHDIHVYKYYQMEP